MTPSVLPAAATQASTESPPPMNPPVSRPVRAVRRQRRTKSGPPCPTLPKNLTGNEVERVVMARIQRDGCLHQQNFSLHRYGTWEAAAEAAEAWLAEIITRLPTSSGVQTRLSARNRSGIIGVHYDPGAQALRSGRQVAYPAYVSRWPGAKNAVRWRFSINQGAETAFLMACLSRELRSGNPLIVGQAVRHLSPERRAALLAMRLPIQLAASARRDGDLVAA